MNKKEKNLKVQEAEKKVNSMLKNFVAKDKKIASKEGFTWRDISKVQITVYIGQEDTTLEVYFYSSGNGSNNKPYKYYKKLSSELANKFTYNLNEARRLDSTIDDDDLDPLKNW